MPVVCLLLDPPLGAPLAITGRANVVLWVSTRQAGDTLAALTQDVRGLENFLAWSLPALPADIAARTIRAPVELPIGVVTAAAGAQFFLWLMRTQLSTTRGR